MNRNGLAEHVADALNLSKTEAGRVVEAVLAGIVDAMRRGEEVRLIGFGTFVVVAREPSRGRDPNTGAALEIPAAKTIRFRAGSALKAAMNKRV